MQKLQIAIYIGTIFIVLIIILIFWGVIPGLGVSRGVTTRLTLWGTISDVALKEVIHDYQTLDKSIGITYVKKDPDTYEQQLVDALASGQGPDMWMMPPSWVDRHYGKISLMPTVLMTEREFLETYAGATTDAFFQSQKIVALPLYIDPLVLFWNKDFFASEAIALPPKTWNEFLDMSERLTRRSSEETIIRSGAAMGLASNIPEAKDIVSLITLQGGGSIVDQKTHRVTLGEGRLVNDLKVNPAESALRFYTDFARRSKKSYTWNNTFPDPLTAFAREQAAMFVGYASNYDKIRKINSHLNIGVSPVPQFENSALIIGHARTIGVTVANASRNKTAAWQFIKYLTTQKANKMIAQSLNLAPSRRDLLAQRDLDPVPSVVYESALRAKTWYDPNETASAQIFANMIESTLTGTTFSTAISEADKRINNLIIRKNP
jgi:multiple sugar transport system substrate-binding protein